LNAIHQERAIRAVAGSGLPGRHESLLPVHKSHDLI
jgi:hypothetical protein